ncbi:MAG: PaaI family thioesterase [Mycobacteriaceae bacterium]
MTITTPPAGGLDPETPLSVLRRFAVTTLEQDMDEFVVVAQMPAAGMRNPFTGQPSVAALAVLVDDVGGRVNFYRRGKGEWTVSSELNMEMSPGAVESLMTAPDEPVVASARPLGPAGATWLSVCTLSHRGRVIGGGTVRTVALTGGPEEPLHRGDDPLTRTPETALADLMGVEPLPADGGTYRLRQHPDPMVNNLIGIVHGGVSSAGLELVGAAAFNHEQQTPLRTASIRVNFLRPFTSGAQSVYEATALRIGRTSAVADAAAIGPDGRPAVIARVTGYR